jgi:hypothetical protein
VAGRPSVHARFTQAVDALVARIREDRSVLAAILCGSLSHDTVWEKSDVDLLLVTIDDRKVKEGHVALDADGINVHALLVPRAAFRTSLESALRSSFFHSFLAKGRLLYTHDETIAALLDELQTIGARDARLQLFAAGCHALPLLYKARKWLVTRGDAHYAALWLLDAASPLAAIEVVSARQLVGREVVLQALALRPDFFEQVYTDILGRAISRESVGRAREAAAADLGARAAGQCPPVLEHLADAGEARGAGEIEEHFARTLGIRGATTACEYLADVGRIGRASTPVRLTPRSHVAVEEVAFYALEPRA